MATNVCELFNTTLPAALTEHADDAKTVGAKFQFNIAGAGEWNVDLTASGPSCTPGSGKADCTVSLAEADFQTLLENPSANAMKLFFNGKLKVTGNQMLGMKLSKIFAYIA